MYGQKSALSLLISFAAVVGAAPAHAQEKSGAAELPEVMQMLEQKGLTNVAEFDLDADLRGFAGVAGQQPITVYVTPDGNAIVGNRIDAQGQSLDEQRLHDLVSKPLSDQIWAQLKAATWVADGPDDAARVVYTFSDPNCPYCNRFWESARPWVEAGKVQLRHVMVGVIKADSSTKVAAILGADDPAAALTKNEETFAQGGITPAKSIPEDVRTALNANQQLMTELGFRGTPGIVYLGEDGMVQQMNGLPPDEKLGDILGPR